MSTAGSVEIRRSNVYDDCSRFMTIMLTALIVCLSTALSTAEYVWLEGEEATKTNLSDGHPFVSRHKNLSGGVSYGTASGTAHATYEFNVKKAGTWHIYVRKFWLHGPFKWQMNKNPVRELHNGNTVLMNATGLGRQHMSIHWAYMGKTTLKKGSNTLQIDGTDPGKPFVLDCFVISERPFEPNGTKKPGEKLGLADPDRWAFEPDYDDFDKDDALNLRSLNEKVAGENGYISMNDQGDFVDGKGKHIRFWCTQGASLQQAAGTELIAQHARHIAKRGVNMYRHHGSLVPADDNPMNTNKSEIDAIQKLVAVMKKQGIYCTVSPIFPTHSEGRASWGIEGYRGGKLTGLLFWHDDFKKIYKKWLKDLLTSKNPYDDKKTPLAKDPALAILQIQNEDSLMWYSIRDYTNNPQLLGLLQKKYDAWLKKKKFAPKKLNLNLWEAGYSNADSIKHTMHFFTEEMRAFNEEIARYIRKDLKCKALINAGNWRTAHQGKLLDLERWSYTANEVIGVNRYVNGNAASGGSPHFNTSEQHKTGYMLRVGDYFQDVSATLNPSKLATNAKQVAGQTFIIPESTWVSPMSYQSEGPFLVAAYSALNGVDGFYWFALGSPGYDSSINKWQVANPSIMGSWPAAALMFRSDYIKRGELAVYEERSMDDMWQLRSPIIVEEAGFDQNRDANIAANSAVKGAIPEEAYLIGPVEVKYNGDSANNKAIDFNKYIKGSKINSNTNEICMDTSTGLCTLNAAKVQGACGFLSKAGSIDLDTVSIVSQNEYASIIVVSLDGKDLKSSKKVLVQLNTKCRPYGWKQRAVTYSDGEKSGIQGYRIEDLGGIPWNVWKGKAEISLKNTKLKKATILDINLYPVNTKLKLSKKSGRVSFDFPEDAMYVVLE